MFIKGLCLMEFNGLKLKETVDMFPSFHNTLSKMSSLSILHFQIGL